MHARWFALVASSSALAFVFACISSEPVTLGPAGSSSDASSPDASGSGAIHLRGTAQFALQDAKAVVLSAPADSQPGDSIWIAIGVTLTSSPATITAPPGLTAKGTRRIQGPDRCNFLDLAYFSGRTTQGGAQTYTFQVDATSVFPTVPIQTTGVLVDYAGVDPVQSTDDEREAAMDRDDADSSDSFAYVTPSVRTQTPNGELLYFLGDNGGTTWDDPPDGIERLTDTGVLAAFAVRSPASGTATPQRFTIHSPKCGFTGGGVRVVALRPAK